MKIRALVLTLAAAAGATAATAQEGAYKPGFCRMAAPSEPDGSTGSVYFYQPEFYQTTGGTFLFVMRDFPSGVSAAELNAWRAEQDKLVRAEADAADVELVGWTMLITQPAAGGAMSEYVTVGVRAGDPGRAEGKNGVKIGSLAPETIVHVAMAGPAGEVQGLYDLLKKFAGTNYTGGEIQKPGVTRIMELNPALIPKLGDPGAQVDLYLCIDLNT